jgi:hypothetical protein
MRDREREREREEEGLGFMSAYHTPSVPQTNPLELVPMQKKPTAVAGKSPRQRAEYTVGLEGGK